jgi:hypothetical protein
MSNGMTMLEFALSGTAGMLNWLDNVAAARDLAQLEKHAAAAELFGVWLEHEAGVAPAAAGNDQRPEMEVSCSAAASLLSGILYSKQQGGGLPHAT